MTYSRTHDTHEHDIYTDSFIAGQLQIKLDAVLSWEIQVEEQKHLAEYIRQIKHQRSLNMNKPPQTPSFK